jgi:hypothetical protein
MQNWGWITLTHRTREQEQKNAMFFKCTKQWVNMSKRHCRDGRGKRPSPSAALYEDWPWGVIGSGTPETKSQTPAKSLTPKDQRKPGAAV